VQKFVSDEVKPALKPYTASLSTVAVLDLWPTQIQLSYDSCGLLSWRESSECKLAGPFV